MPAQRTSTSDKSRCYSTEPADKRAFTDKWDRSYSRTARAYDLAVRWLPGWKTWLRRAIPHVQGPRVLEISFGTGYLISQYAGRFNTHGIDFNRTMVQTARRNLHRHHVDANLTQASVEALPYADGAFDTVVNTMAFSGYPDAQRAMSEIRRVLKPSGRLVLIDFNYPRNGNWLGSRLTRFWIQAGDLIRDLDGLLSKFGFDYQDKEIGAFGSVHLYVATKR